MTVRKGKRPSDPNKLAKWVVEQSTESADAPPALPVPKSLSAYMSAMGRKGGAIGGKARLVTMTPEKRRETAQKAAKARWSKKASSLNPTQ